MSENTKTTRADHLKWCKQRALDAMNYGGTQEGFASMLSDLGKHEETKQAQELCASLGMSLMIAGHLNSDRTMREFIEGFN